jgi:hypothetical protein
MCNKRILEDFYYIIITYILYKGHPLKNLVNKIIKKCFFTINKRLLCIKKRFFTLKYHFL